jgi:hypothetical protein
MAGGGGAGRAGGGAGGGRSGGAREGGGEGGVTNQGARALQHLARPRRRLSDDRPLAPPAARVSTAAGAGAGRRRINGQRIGHCSRLLLREPRVVRLCALSARLVGAAWACALRAALPRIRRPAGSLVHANLWQRLARRQRIPNHALHRRQYVRPLAIGRAQASERRRTTT